MLALTAHSPTFNKTKCIPESFPHDGWTNCWTDQTHTALRSAGDAIWFHRKLGCTKNQCEALNSTDRCSVSRQTSHQAHPTCTVFAMELAYASSSECTHVLLLKSKAISSPSLQTRACNGSQDAILVVEAKKLRARPCEIPIRFKTLRCGRSPQGPKSSWSVL